MRRLPARFRIMMKHLLSYDTGSRMSYSGPTQDGNLDSIPRLDTRWSCGRPTSSSTESIHLPSLQRRNGDAGRLNGRAPCPSTSIPSARWRLVTLVRLLSRVSAVVGTQQKGRNEELRRNLFMIAITYCSWQRSSISDDTDELKAATTLRRSATAKFSLTADQRRPRNHKGRAQKFAGTQLVCQEYAGQHRGCDDAKRTE